jgi:hypothetical protein
MSNDDWQPHQPPPPPAAAELERLFADMHWHQRWEIFADHAVDQG